MKSRNLFLGIIILFIGVVALLASLGTISFSWQIALRLWPLLLIFLGIAILPVKDLFKAILLLVTLGAGVLLYQNEAKNHPERNRWGNWFSSSNWDWDDDDDYDNDSDDEFDEGPFSQQFSEPYEAFTKATLNIDFGAGELEIGNPSAELIKVNSESNFAKYDFRVEKLNEEANVFLTGKGKTKNINGRTENKLYVALSDFPTWDFTISTGAADCDFDFMPYKVGSINIESGVCDMDIRLGDKGQHTTMNIESGVSDIDIEVPANVGCKITLDSAITGKDFAGFQKIEKGVYQTDNFGQTEQQIVINLECGVSDISVERY